MTNFVDPRRIELLSSGCPEIVCERPREQIQFRDPVIFVYACGDEGI
jgi:hypothetical protein